MKKFIGVLILLSIAMFPVNAAFSDVRTDHVYKTAIDYVQAQGIVSGYSDGKFRPGNSITRGEFTKIIINSVYSVEEISQMSASLYAPACETCQGFGVVKIFNDLVSTSEWARYAFVAKQNGIVSGYSDGTFKPNNYITAGQASKIIANAFKMVNQSNLQVDPNDKFKPYIQALVNRRAIPQEVKSRESYLTRGEMAEIIYRVKNYVIDKPYTELSNILTNTGRVEFRGKSFIYDFPSAVEKIEASGASVIFWMVDGSRFDLDYIVNHYGYDDLDRNLAINAVLNNPLYQCIGDARNLSIIKTGFENVYNYSIVKSNTDCGSDDQYANYYMKVYEDRSNNSAIVQFMFNGIIEGGLDFDSLLRMEN